MSDPGIDQLFQQIGDKVRDIVNRTFAETQNQSLESAVDLLHHRLSALSGVAFDRTWAQHAIETLRRGDDLEIRIG